jgi:hypothetical protein
LDNDLNKNNAFLLYSISTYKEANKKFINEKAIIVEDINEMKKYLETNNGYHYRVHE